MFPNNKERITSHALVLSLVPRYDGGWGWGGMRVMRDYKSEDKMTMRLMGQVVVREKFYSKNWYHLSVFQASSYETDTFLFPFPRRDFQKGENCNIRDEDPSDGLTNRGKQPEKLPNHPFQTFLITAQLTRVCIRQLKHGCDRLQKQIRSGTNKRDQLVAWNKRKYKAILSTKTIVRDVKRISWRSANAL